MKRKGVLIVILSALLLAGCQVKEKIVKVPVPVIRLGVWSYGNTIGSNDLSLMNRALGNLTEKKAGFRLEIFDISTSTDYRLLLSGEENSKSRADIVGMYNSQFSSLAYEGYLLELENYLTEDSEILVEASCNKDELYINGHIYGIPKPMLEVNTRGLVVSNELLKKYDFSLTEINSLADMEPLLMTIIENEAEIIPLASISGGMRLFSLNEYADIVDSGIGVRYDDSSTKIVNLYTQKEYADFIQLMYRWRKMGIIDERMNQIEELGLNLVVEGDAFASDIIIRPDEVQEYKALYGDRIEIIDFHQKPKISMLQYLWGISSSCQFPELAMKALELLYTDKEVNDLLIYGVEDIHYVRDKDGFINLPEGKSVEETGYYMKENWQFNRRKASLRKGMDLDVFEQLEEFTEQAVSSSLYGFSVDYSTCTTNNIGIVEAINKYSTGLEMGYFDPDEILPIFIAELEAAGIEQRIAEIQLQINAWKAENP